MSLPTRFAGTVVVVTGAASGIGRAVAERLAAEGGAVACLDVAEEGAAKTEASITGAGGTARAFGCDVADEQSVGAAVAALTGELGPPTVLCNVAGIGRFDHTEQLELADWDRVLRVNLTGTFLMCKAVLPHLLERGGAIVNTASTAGLMAQPYSAAYCASKGGVVMLTRAMGWEYVKRGVRVNAVAPGGIETPIHGSFLPPDDADMALINKVMPPTRFGRADDVASLFAYLASDEARYVTGTVMTVDGGMTS